MNDIDRSIVKLQARQMIKNRVFILFIISIVAYFLTTGLSCADYIYDAANKSNNSSAGSGSYGDFGDYFGGNGGYDDFDDFYEKNYGSQDDNPIESFGEPQDQAKSAETKRSNNAWAERIFNLLSVAAFFLMPLVITLYGFYASFIKRSPSQELSLGRELSGLFKSTFNYSYGKKLLLYFLRTLFTALLSFLLIFPGVMYYYSSYFAYQLMCEYPNMKPTQALKLSKKIVRYHRGELFALDLSFIPWYLLCIVTCGVASIYVIPYVMTTQALYYENFKLRARVLGVITDADFITQGSYNAEYYNYGGTGNYNPGSQNGEYYYNAQTYAQNGTQQNTQNGYSYAQPQGDQPYGYSYYGQSGQYNDINNSANNSAGNGTDSPTQGGYYYQPPEQSPPQSGETPFNDNGNDNPK